ncbi:hypothetical protein DPMN_128368 [Dreissena polymorpha]|uniref:Uncharacterized protein n=1 Tax=Dreissena polymorpha TaxID=45954 RepID=A0A9D4JZL7_DREPO|nr:hypothetical protein DPMN_128368 [Dreissena polymorpha]
MNPGGTGVREQLSLSKMTPEMFRAIRRQERTTGFDYWKAGFAGTYTHMTSPERRKPFQRMTQVNLDFPGFPCLDLYGKKKRKDANDVTRIVGQPLTLTRSKTCIDAPLPKPKSRSHNSKKSSFSDLTCLQLTDTIFSYSSVPFSGLEFLKRQIKPAHSKYVQQIISETIDGVDCLNTTEGSSDDTPQSHLDETDGYLPLQDGHVGTLKAATYRLSSPKPQKSILKNRGLPKQTVNHESDSECALCEFEPARPAVVCSYQLPSTARYGALPDATAYSHHGSITVMSAKLKNHVCNTSASGALKRRPSETSRQIINSDTVDGFSDRKRVVRFNAANQIHEYTPLKRLYHFDAL